MPMVASMSSVEFICDEIVPKCCNECRSPPQNSEVPSTSSKFERMLPSNDNCTSLNKPLFKAVIATMSSVAFPNVALRRPPTVSFVCMANCSVTNPNLSASGASAIKLKMNVTVLGHSA
jgi:hypothetical protein